MKLLFLSTDILRYIFSYISFNDLKNFDCAMTKNKHYLLFLQALCGHQLQLSSFNMLENFNSIMHWVTSRRIQVDKVIYILADIFDFYQIMSCQNVTEVIILDITKTISYYTSYFPKSLPISEFITYYKQQFHNVIKLDIRYCTNIQNSDILRLLRCMPSITYLRLPERYCRKQFSKLLRVKRFQKLTNLEFIIDESDCAELLLDNLGLIDIQLHTLKIGRSKIQNLANLATQTTLHTFQLINCSYIGNTINSAIPVLAKTLRHLSLKNCNVNNNELLQILIDYKHSLISIELSSVFDRITLNRFFENSPSLTQIILHQYSTNLESNYQLYDDTVKIILCSCIQLKEFTIYSNRLTFEGISSAIKQCIFIKQITVFQVLLLLFSKKQKQIIQSLLNCKFDSMEFAY